MGSKKRKHGFGTFSQKTSTPVGNGSRSRRDDGRGNGQQRGSVKRDQPDLGFSEESLIPLGGSSRIRQGDDGVAERHDRQQANSGPRNKQDVGVSSNDYSTPFGPNSRPRRGGGLVESRHHGLQRRDSGYRDQSDSLSLSGVNAIPLGPRNRTRKDDGDTTTNNRGGGDDLETRNGLDSSSNGGRDSTTHTGAFNRQHSSKSKRIKAGEDKQSQLGASSTSNSLTEDPLLSSANRRKDDNHERDGKRAPGSGQQFVSHEFSYAAKFEAAEEQQDQNREPDLNDTRGRSAISDRRNAHDKAAPDLSKSSLATIARPTRSNKQQTGEPKIQTGTPKADGVAREKKASEGVDLRLSLPNQRLHAIPKPPKDIYGAWNMLDGVGPLRPMGRAIQSISVALEALKVPHNYSRSHRSAPSCIEHGLSAYIFFLLCVPELWALPAVSISRKIFGEKVMALLFNPRTDAVHDLLADGGSDRNQNVSSVDMFLLVLTAMQARTVFLQKFKNDPDQAQHMARDKVRKVPAPRRFLRLLDEFTILKRLMPTPLLPMSPDSKNWAECVTSRLIWAHSFNNEAHKDEMWHWLPKELQEYSLPYKEPKESDAGGNKTKGDNRKY